MAFCDTNLTGDVMWGSLDRKGVLTIGFGDTKDPSQKDAIHHKLVDKFGELLPGLKEKYSPDDMRFSFGAISVTDNALPIAGRLPDFDVSAGWGGRGIAQSFAFAKAYAKHVVLGKTSDLRRFESLNIHTAATPLHERSLGAGFDIAATEGLQADILVAPTAQVAPKLPRKAL